MDWWQAVVLGVVEGVTEFLPVSSTGHLILAQRAVGIRSSEAADAYLICIQAGAILAVLGLYWRHAVAMLRGLLGRDPVGLRLLVNISIAFIPAAVVGLLFNKLIKEKLFGLWPVVGAWMVGGVVILLVAWRTEPPVGARPQTVPQRGSGRQRGVEELTPGGALVIGLFQVLALWPGTSRSLVTILGGLAVGFALPAAVEFSFLLGVVTLLAATGYEGYKHGHAIAGAYTWESIGIGFVLAALTAAASVAWMVSYLNRHGLALFGYYRVALAAVVGGLLVSGWLLP
jgi:undecaprenyl-diphosphatase